MRTIYSQPSTTGDTRKRHFWHKKKFRIFIIIIGILLIIRIALPYILLHFANQRLANVPGYYGHVQDLDLSLWRGAYKLKNLNLDKVDSVTKAHTKFIDVKLIDLSLEWKALFHGRLVGKLMFDHPVLRFTKDKTDPAKVQKDTVSFSKLLKSFMPLKVNKCEINHGDLHYIDPASKPLVDIYMSETHVLAQNLSNVVDSSKLPSSIVATAATYGGNFTFNMQLNPLAKDPYFQMKAQLENADLTRFNDFLMAYANFDINRGIFGMYMELAAADGRFIGYVKPFIKNLDVVGPNNRKGSILHAVWEEIVGAAGVLLRNQSKDQIATKIPIEGTFKQKTSTDMWGAIAILLRNAFIQALIPSIDNEIDISSVYNPPKDEQKGFFKKLFGKHK